MSERRWPSIDYCDDCGVSLDLHPEDMERRTACGVAVRKAETIEAFGRVGSDTTGNITNPDSSSDRLGADHSPGVVS